MRQWIITGLFLLIAEETLAQQFGGTPPSQKWKQIDTDSARIIFPPGLDSAANRIASIVHWLAEQKPFSLGDQIKKINIVLQQHTTISNAYAGLGPFRSEYYLNPLPSGFELGTISWIDQLSLHEYRHVQQFNNFNHGASKVMKILAGEDGYSLAINAAIPEWFFEGDAVYLETVLSEQGRGRIPLFLNTYPSLWQAGKKYSWMKLRNGSLKDYVPSHYPLGYLLVNYGHQKYGADFWARVTKEASEYKGLIYPFQSAIKRQAGVAYKTFRENALEYYKSKTVVPPGQSADSFVFPVKKDYVKSYYFPHQAGADSLIYMKYSYRHRPAFYINTGGEEHRIRTRDISTDNQFSYRDGKIVYAAYETDPRWHWRSYSVIRLLDIHTGQQRSLTSKSKYFAPDISPDGSKVAAVQVDINGKSELHIIDAGSGQVLKAIHSADIRLFSDPKFIDEGNLVTAVRLKDGKMALALAEIETGNTMRLTTPSFNIVGYPSVYNGVIYFTASYGGNDDVFALRLSNNKIYRISNGPLGNYNVNAANGKISWTVFTAEGYQLKQMDEKDIVWNEIAIAAVEILRPAFEPSQAGLYGNILGKKIPERIFPVKDYKKGTGLLNFHSWRPDYSDPLFTFSVYGQNILNTLQTEVYYLHHFDEETNSVGFNTVYGAWFPYLSLGSEYTFNRQGLTANRIRTWDQLDTRFGLTLPVSKASGKTYKNLSASSNYVLRNEYNKGFFKDSIGNTSFGYLLHTLAWTEQAEKAVQHIYPRFAYSVSSNYRHAISRYEGYQFIGNASVYVPGILSTHNLILSGSFQQRDTSLALFATRFTSARGYPDYYRTNAGSRLTRLSADYHFPLVYPDWGFANIFYLQRVRANIFYDHQQIYSNDKKNSSELKSTGVECFLDTKWWNQHPLSFGFRFSFYLNDDILTRNKKGMSIFEFVLPVNLY